MARLSAETCKAICRELGIEPEALRPCWKQFGDDANTVTAGFGTAWRIVQRAAESGSEEQ